MVSYKPLFHTMIEKGITREQLRELVKAGKTTFVKLYAGKNVSMDLIERICLKLNVPVSAVLEFLPNEQDENEDRLYMVDLLSQENVSLFSFSDVATSGTSAPSIYGAWIAWAGPDPEPVEDSTVTSAIYYVNLDEDIHDDGLQMRTYRPDTYVHEPLFNGRYFCWIDTNKSFNARLYVAQPNATPVVIDGGVSAYGLGDGIVVYGKNNAIYVYVIATGEICMLTGAGEKGILPQVSGRTVL